MDIELKELKTPSQHNGSHTTVQEFTEDKFFGNVRIEEDTAEDDDDTLIVMKNVHKTYLLGIEGVPALRCACVQSIH